MKQAYSSATQAGTIGQLLNRLFQHTFSVAKQVRTDTAIGASPVSVAFAAVSLSKQIFSDLSKHTALLIGAGETIELVARHLHESGVGRIIVANRTVEKAHNLASEFGGYAIALSEIPDHLAEADVVISSTASQLPILGKGAVETALKQRKRRPISPCRVISSPRSASWRMCFSTLWMICRRSFRRDCAHARRRHCRQRRSSIPR